MVTPFKSNERLSLIQVDNSSENLELVKRIESDRDSALRNLVLGKTPTEVIFQKPGRGGGKQDYVPGWWFCQEANALFSHLWSQEVKESTVDTENDQIFALVKISIHIPGRVVTVTNPDGSRVETRYESVTISKEQFGGSIIKRMKPKSGGKGPMVDLADDLKSATTDGMKKCFSLLGFARDIYGPRERPDTEEEVGPDPTYLKLLGRGEKLGWDETTVNKWIVENSKKSLDQVTPTDYWELLGKIPKPEVAKM